MNCKIRHFGRWGRVQNGKLVPVEGGGWKEAWDLYRKTLPDPIAGRGDPAPVVKAGDTDGEPSDMLTVRGLCELFMQANHRFVVSGELGHRMFRDYQDVVNVADEVLGRNQIAEDLKPADFGRLRAGFARRWGPVQLKNNISQIPSVFAWGHRNELLERPTRFGTEFSPPTRSVLRRHKAERGDRAVEALAIRKIVEKAPTPLKAMVLLAIKSGFGNADLGALALASLDLDGGWVNFPRQKTAIPRRCSLWPETVKALREAMA